MKTKRILSIMLTLVMLLSLMASTVITVSAEVDKTPLTFIGTENFKIRLLKNGTTDINVNLEYSLNNSSWNTYTTGDEIEVSNASKSVYFRGSDNNTFGGINSNYYYWSITDANGETNVKIAASGNINTLLDYQNPPTEFSADNKYCFCDMFYNCKTLTTAPNLPATVLADYCYIQMFEGCTSLTKAPELPATTLADSCYATMFKGCTSLTKAPELPATTLADSCYASMFNSCTSLTTAPELPATNLANLCYNRMFGSCTALTTAPELKATTLKKSCYYQMFSGCEALTTPPELKATTLADECYFGMFQYCFKLRVYEVKDENLADWIMPESTSASNWASSMLLLNRFTSSLTIEINKMYRYVRVPIFTNSVDSGYYTQEGKADEGIIAFTSQFTNLATDLVGCVFGTGDKFGMLLYKTDATAEQKTTVEQNTFTDLKDAGGYFYSFVKGISADKYESTVIAMPFAVIKGVTFYGEVISSKVTTDKGTKYLGDIANMPKDN